MITKELIEDELLAALKDQCEWIYSQISWAQADEYMNYEPADSYSYDCYLQATKYSSLISKYEQRQRHEAVAPSERQAAPTCPQRGGCFGGDCCLK
jgi:hypothetical protein